MKKHLSWLLAAAALIAGAAVIHAQTYTGSYVDGGGIYRAPSASKVTKDGAAWTGGNMAFANASTAAGPNIPGEVRVTLSNVTGAGTYKVSAKDGSGAWRELQVFHAAQAPSAGTGTGAPFAVATSVDARLTARHGGGLWNTAGSVNVLPFQGAASYETVSQGKDVHVVRGDSVSIPYSIGKNLTGWTVWFGAKANAADPSYSIPLMDVTAQMTSPAAGSGLISLSTSDTDAMPRRYSAELEARKAGEVSTALRFYLWIDADIIR